MISYIGLSKIEKLWLFCLGLPFSFLASTKVLQISGRFIPEVFILIWIICTYLFFTKRFNELGGFLRKNNFYILIIFIFSISLIGLLRDDIDLASYYARMRSLILFTIAIYIGYYAQKSEKYELYLDVLLWLVLGAIFFNFLHTLFATFTTTYIVDNVKVTFPILAYAIAIFLLIRRKQKLLPFILVLFLITSSAMSFFRQYYIIATIITFYFLFFGYFFNDNSTKKRISTLLASLIILILLYFSIDFLIKIIMEFLSSDPKRHAQSIGKIEQFIDALQYNEVDSSGNTRLLQYQFLLNNFESFFLPNGLINDKVYVLKSIWGGETFYMNDVAMTKDSLFAYIITTFGWFISSIFFLFFNILTLKSLFNNINEKKSSILFFYFLFWFLFFLDGTLIGQFEKALFTGIIVTFAFPNYNKIEQKGSTYNE